MRRRLWADRELGATAVEYSLMAAFIVAAIVVLLGTIGRQVLAQFTSLPPF